MRSVLMDERFTGGVARSETIALFDRAAGKGTPRALYDSELEHYHEADREMAVAYAPTNPSLWKAHPEWTLCWLSGQGPLQTPPRNPLLW